MPFKGQLFFLFSMLKTERTGMVHSVPTVLIETLAYNANSNFYLGFSQL